MAVGFFVYRGESSMSNDNYDIRTIFWDSVEPTGIEEYNEAFLAELRTELKEISEGTEILLVPRRFSGEGSFWGSEENSKKTIDAENENYEYFSAAMLHLARRCKDCECIVGFAYPDFEQDWKLLKDSQEVLKEDFAGVFKKKHKHYIFQ